MGNWLDSINSEMAGIDEFIDSKEELDPKVDEIVGTMNERLRKLYTLLQRTRKSGEEWLDNIDKSNLEEEDLQRAVYRVNEIATKAGLIREMFVCCVRDECGLWDNYEPPIGIRKGFLIVIPLNHKEKCEKVIDYISKLVEKVRETIIQSHFSKN